MAQKMRRKAIGFEIDVDRAEFAKQGLEEPNKIIHSRIEDLEKYDLPKFDLLFTSPPYTTVRLEDDPWGKTYFEDMTNIFEKIKKVLKPNAHIVIEISNIRNKDGIRPLAWQFGELLIPIFSFQGEIIQCSTTSPVGAGFDHSYLLVFKNH